MRIAQPSYLWRSLALAMFIGVIGGCATAPAPGPTSPPSLPSLPSPGQAASPIGPTSAPTSPTLPTSGPTPPSTPAPSPSGSAPPSSSGFEISGTFEQSSDTTTDDGAHVVHTVIHQTGTVTASGAMDGTLTGSASYVYRKDYKFVGEGCATEWTTGDVAWDTAVSGTYQRQEDFSFTVSLTPADAQGPGIPEDMICLGDITENPISWPFAGTLVNGVFDSHTDLIPPGSPGSDFSWIEEHLQTN